MAFRGRANLVADVREEARLGLVGGFGRMRPALGFPAVRDVRSDGDVLLDATVVAQERGDDALDPVERAILGAIADLATPALSTGDRAPEVTPERGIVSSRVDDAVVAPQQFATRIAAHATEVVVDVEQRALRVGHRVQRMLFHRAEQGGVFAQGRAELQRAFLHLLLQRRREGLQLSLGAHPLPDVPQGHADADHRGLRRGDGRGSHGHIEPVPVAMLHPGIDRWMAHAFDRPARSAARTGSVGAETRTGSRRARGR